MTATSLGPKAPAGTPSGRPARVTAPQQGQAMAWSWYSVTTGFNGGISVTWCGWALCLRYPGEVLRHNARSNPDGRERSDQPLRAEGDPGSSPRAPVALPLKSFAASAASGSLPGHTFIKGSPATSYSTIRKGSPRHEAQGACRRSMEGAERLRLFGCFNVKTGRVLGSCTEARKREDFFSFMDLVARRYPRGRVHVVLDNLNTHLDTRRCDYVTQWNRRRGAASSGPRTPCTIAEYGVDSNATACCSRR
jgi:DDE superfamily endonuclease